ncbi:MAG: energy-coupling factor transporter transmembrane protein EcfT [Erysipelotrichaceae bacterium]|jgi:energy-coupling factor transport system permease protein|nr:energy-coupling factor transporter transmembrane protein EcfT [Erysipelotrichaceae bacterium]
MNDFVFGRFQKRDTFFHRLDPRLKLFTMITLIVLLFFNYPTWQETFIGLGIFGGISLIAILINRTSFLALLKMILPLSFLLIFLLLINVFFPTSGTTMLWFTIGDLPIYLDSIFQTLKVLLRLVIMLSFTLILTESTSSIDLTHAFEWYLTPLKLIKFPVSVVAMTMSIALRFIPTIGDEITRIMKAQTSRGVDFNRGGLLKRSRAIISLIVPLFISAFERSEELALAMEARGYDPYAKRTRYQIMKFTWRDLVMLLLILGFLTLFILYRIYWMLPVGAFFTM